MSVLHRRLGEAEISQKLMGWAPSQGEVVGVVKDERFEAPWGALGWPLHRFTIKAVLRPRDPRTRLSLIVLIEDPPSKQLKKWTITAVDPKRIFPWLGL